MLIAELLNKSSQMLIKKVIDGELVHDPSTCDAANTIGGVQYNRSSYRLHQHWLQRLHL